MLTTTVIVQQRALSNRIFHMLMTAVSLQLIVPLNTKHTEMKLFSEENEQQKLNWSLVASIPITIRRLDLRIGMEAF